jgi:hypothetical protein
MFSDASVKNQIAVPAWPLSRKLIMNTGKDARKMGRNNVN